MDFPTFTLDTTLLEESKEPEVEKVQQFFSYCIENGLVILVCGIYGNVIRFLAPFVITDDQLYHGLEIMEKGFKKIFLK